MTSKATEQSSEEAAATRPSQLADALVATLFALLLALPILDRHFDIDPVPAREPLREAAPPMLGLTAPQPLKERIADLKERAKEGFGFRDALLSLHGLAQVRLLRSSANEKVVLGKAAQDGDWFFLRSEGALDAERALQPFDDALLDKLVATLEAQHRYLAEHGVRYVLVLVPTKHGIYPEFLPDWATRLEGPSRRDQLLEALRERTQVEVLDLRPTLLAAKEEARVYYRTDSHWNRLGARSAYQRILEAIGPALGLRALSADAFETTERAGFSGDLARMSGLRGFETEKIPALRVVGRDRARIAYSGGASFEHLTRYKESFTALGEDADAPRALIVRDSFGDLLFAFLAQHFSTTRVAWVDSFDLQSLLPRWIESGEGEEKPDIVLHLRVDRSLMRLGLREKVPSR